MNPSAFYSEWEAYPAEWLRNLMRAGEIMRGRVDERSIRDIWPDDLAGFRRAHFFAGIGGWDYALRLSDWPDDREVWTGSCPCQPFSAAGKGEGFADERHLWPDFFRLIAARRPATVMGEQVASPDGLRWLDLVCADLEGAGYTVRAADICAAGIGAPHIRQRLWWRADRLADAERGAAERHGHALAGQAGSDQGREEERERLRADARDAGNACGLADRNGAGPQGRGEPGRERAAQRLAGPGGVAGGLADRNGAGRLARDGDDPAPRHGISAAADRQPDRASPLHGFWRDADWLWCRDGKWRPVEPGTFPLADGLPRGMVRLRAGNVAHRAATLAGYGNAIVPQLAAAFIRMTEAMDREAAALAFVARADAAILPAYRDAVRTYPDGAWKDEVMAAIARRMAELAKGRA